MVKMMAATTQTYLGLESESSPNTGFQSVLNYIREAARSEYHKGELFERLMQKYFSEDPVYKEQFSEIWVYKQWAALRTDYDADDIGIDLVAQKRDGGYCAIQCKCYAEDTRIPRSHLDSFISASASELFTSRIIVDTGGEWGQNALKTIDSIKNSLRIIRYNDLESSPFIWPDLSRQDPEELIYRQKKFYLKDHQKEAFDDVIKGFKDSDRGKLIMASGTGKTFTALKIAEEIAGTDSRVLYLTPYIGLLSQAMRQWSEQRSIPHSYVGICSDTSAGNINEDTSILELKIPVTTDPLSISYTLQHPDQDKMTVVFCTYQLLPLVEEAQNEGAPPFDIIFCDEAHRTTGVEHPGDRTSSFILVHNEDRIRANKRLYMTATPRLYTEGAKTKAANYNSDVFSMDDEDRYGPQFHCLPLSKAVEIGELLDYKVVGLSISEQDVNTVLKSDIGLDRTGININDATKIIGCWRALQNPEIKEWGDESIKPLKRVIAFTNKIKESKDLTSYWDSIIQRTIETLSEGQYLSDFKCETAHVAGTDHVLTRKQRLDWLKGGSDDVCRILSNARYLSEGIDTPVLDGLIFMTPPSSHVDLVQAVGRVMRKVEGKDFAYIVLPVAIPNNESPATALDDNQRFAKVWRVLRALRSHDDRLNAEINSIDLNQRLPDRIIFGKGGVATDSTWDTQQQLMPVEIPIKNILPKIVEKCGDKRYWENWAKDMAEIFGRLIDRLENLLENPGNEALREWFDSLHEELKNSINTSITRSNAIDMMAQHILTRPVFNALFEDYDFSAHNPIASTLDNLQKVFTEFGLESETRDLAGFYESVQTLASGIKSGDGRQKFLSDLYENFFKKALKKETDRLGIAYTPIPLVDFVLHSVNDVLKEEFGRGLSDEGVHILDPFTGTGTFLVRLLQSEIIHADDLKRKYREELHANEILLLAYYIACVNIEEAFRARSGGDNSYEPFKGIVLTDTFNLNKSENSILFPKEWCPDNNELADQEQKLPIQVIIGNPPWSAWQKSYVDGNPNVEYPELEKRISDTYAVRTTATLKKSLYDTYKMAIRWATDKIQKQKQGVVAFVTPASWIEGNVDAGIRACLPEEFSSIYVLNLRGNARLSPSQSHSEGENVFGNATRSPVAITILVKNPKATHLGCQIHYRQIGDALKREEKFTKMHEAKSIYGFSDWQIIIPDQYYDWTQQRSKAFAKFYPLGTNQVKTGRSDNAIFKLFSSGSRTSKNAYIYNFSRDACAKNAKRMVQDYLDAIAEFEEHPELPLNEIARRHVSNITWNRDLENNLRRRRKTEYDESYIRKVAYRPFIQTNCYADYTFIQRRDEMHRLFPEDNSENRVICVPGIGSKNPFSVLITDKIPDIGFNNTCQCFPRFRYREPVSPRLIMDVERTEQAQERIDNISDTALRVFQEHYRDDTVTKNAIFDYIYGILHAPGYRESFAYDLSRELPRIPFAPDFYAFVEAGRSLATLHLNYETCERYPLRVEPRNYDLFWEERPEHFLLEKQAMRFADRNTKNTLIINRHVLLSGIPEKAHQYVVNDRTPLDWFINRYKITQDKSTGIINDPNDWFEHPRDLITAIERIVYVSVESTKIIEKLPSNLTSE